MLINKLAMPGLLALVLFCSSVAGVAVMSVDLGSEWMKIGIVSPGVPMEIVLNKESKRKTAAVVAFRDNIRTFGEDAQNIGVRFPKNNYIYLLDLVGKEVSNPIVQLYRQRFPQYELVEDPERHTVLFKHEEGVLYSPEELIAQLLHKAKEFAEQSAQQPVNELVLTVPGFFNQAERRSLLQAAELSGLKVLQLMNDYTAVALNYGIFRRKDFNDSAQYVMFYDMGASKTTATVVSYQNAKTKERGYVETNPMLSVLGVGYDRTLGGLEIQLRLRDYLADKFNRMNKTKTDVFMNPRAMAKLFKEAGRLKNVLSANAEHAAQVEGLLDEQDMRLQVTREQLESLIPDLLDRVAGPVHQALHSAGLTMDVIGQVVLVGAGTRVPKIQEALYKTVGMELSKNLNTDEAAAMGAVYKAADLSTGFKVKKFITKDGVLFPVQVVFEREGKQVRRMLFGLMNPYPQKKIITFNKHSGDFSFKVNYAELGHLGVHEEDRLGSLNLSRVQVSGVKAALEKHSSPGVEPKGIKAHFAMDESGILQLASIEATFEKTVSSDKEEESPLSKLGSTISKLFTSGGDGAAENVTDSVPAKQNEIPINKTFNATQNGQNITDQAKPKVVIVKEPVVSDESSMIVSKLTMEQMKKSANKLEELNKEDRARTRRETALNNLETLVIDARVKLDTTEYTEAATQQEIDEIRAACDQISEWLYEEGANADAPTYEEKILQVQKLTNSLYGRVWEHHERPEALKALRQMLNHSLAFLETAKNLTKDMNPDKDVFTPIEIQTLSKVISETEQWTDAALQQQNQLSKAAPVHMTVKSMTDKMATLDREVKYLVNKLKFWRPKLPQDAKDDVKKNQSDKTKAEHQEDGGKAAKEGQHEESEEAGPEMADTPEDAPDQHSEL